MNDIEDRGKEDLSMAQKIAIVVFWFREYAYRTDLKENGYFKKARSRRICVIIGIVLYAVIILLANVKIFSGCTKEQQEVKNYSIDIRDFYGAEAYSIQYHFDTLKLFIVEIGELEGEKPDTIVTKTLAQTDIHKIKTFLRSFPLEQLKLEYNNQLVCDGDQKTIRLSINGNCKTIQISNCPQQDVINLYKMLNTVIDEKYKIRTSE